MYILRHEFQVLLPWSHTHKQTFLHNLWVRGYRSLRSFHPKITNNWFLLCALQNLSWLFNNCARLLACKLSTLTPEIRETGPKYNLITCLNRFFQSFLSFFNSMYNVCMFLCRHPTSCSSMAEIMSVLFFHTMKYKISAPRDASSDRFILSKGHAAPILYAGQSLNSIHTWFFKLSPMGNLFYGSSFLERLNLCNFMQLQLH